MIHPISLNNLKKIYLLKRILFFVLISVFLKANAQTQTLKIEDVNEYVLNKSNKVKIINNNFMIAKIGSTFYEKSLLPVVSSSISLPYQRSISLLVQPDGSQKFIERNFINSVLNLNVSQVVPFTGGSLSLSSSLNTARDFNNNTISFSSNWLNISYQQAINGYNSYKWDKKLNSLNGKKDSILYLKEKLKLKYDISKIYVDTQLFQLKSDLIKQNIEKTKAVLFELEEKLKFGRTIKIEVEQTKILLEQLVGKLEINDTNYKYGIELLKKIMNDSNNTSFILSPVKQEDFIIEMEKTIKAIKANGFDIEKETRILELNSKIDKIKKEGAVNLNLQMGLGLNSSSNDFLTLYDKPTQSQFVTIGARIPLLDWGQNKNKYAIAKLDNANLQLLLAEEEQKIEEEVEDLIHYKQSLDLQQKSLKKQRKLFVSVSEMTNELLLLGRKTISEYKSLISERYNLEVEYQKTINDLYLLKLKINEFNLIL